MKSTKIYKKIALIFAIFAVLMACVFFLYKKTSKSQKKIQKELPFSKKFTKTTLKLQEQFPLPKNKFFKQKVPEPFLAFM